MNTNKQQLNEFIKDLNNKLSKSNYKLDLRNYCNETIYQLDLLVTYENGFINDIVIGCGTEKDIATILITFNILIWNNVNFEGLI